MKKLLWILIAVPFLFTACQKEEANIEPMSASGFAKAAGDDMCVITTKMIAGGGKYDEKCTGYHMGTLTIEETATDVIVTYNAFPGWGFFTTHLYVGAEDGIPSNGGGNTKNGNFPYTGNHSGGVSVVTYTIPLSDLPDNYVVAAHADVDGMDFCESLPEEATIEVTLGTQSYFNLELTNAGSLNGTYPAWCIDVGHTIGSQNDIYSTSVYGTCGSIPELLDGAGITRIDKPDQLPIISWILNQNFVGTASDCGGNFTRGDIQRVIWEYIDDTPFVTYGLGAWSQCRVDEIKAAVEAAGEEATNFMPEAGDLIAVILVPEDDKQVLLMMVPFAAGSDETAWGYGYLEGYCDTDGPAGSSFTDSQYYGGSKWGWYIYGCEFVAEED